MAEKLKQAEGEEELLQWAEEPNVTKMRKYIIDVAQRLSDEKLIKMLYIRAKTLERM